MDKNKIITIEKKDNKERKKHIRNKILVNLITGIRSLGTVAIIPIFVNEGSLITALAAIGFFLTDFIDGLLARKLHVQSFFGSLLDGLSDKAFGIVCLILLSTLNPIFLIIIGVELGILAVNYNSIQRGNNAKSSMAGKVKTFFLAATIVGSFFAYSVPSFKNIVDYVNISSLNTLAKINPQVLSTILAIPSIGAGLYVLKDYGKKATTQDEKKLEEEKDTKKTINLSLKEINEKRKELIAKKEKLGKYKSKQEILHALFDTDFYLEHKDDEIMKLILK